MEGFQGRHVDGLVACASRELAHRDHSCLQMRTGSGLDGPAGKGSRGRASIVTWSSFRWGGSGFTPTFASP